MFTEINVAASYWASEMKAEGLSSNQVALFRRELIQLIHNKVSAKWFTTNPLRGQAARSVSFDEYRMDKLLIEAAQKANICELPSRLPFVYMWIDPGMVSVQRQHQFHPETLYDAKEFQADVNEHLARLSPPLPAAAEPLSCGASELQHQNRGSVVSKQQMLWTGGQHA